MKKDLNDVNKLFHKYPTDSFIRGKYFKLKKALKSRSKKLKYEFKRDILNKIHALKSSNPNKFWKLLENLNIKGHNYTDPSDSVPAQAWQDHFSCLLNENKTLKFDNSTQKLVDEFINNYDMKPLTKNINIDYRITEEEIIKCIRQLKSGKSSGTDGIKNEMLKVATPYIMCHLVKLFNSILNSGKFPANWSHSLITPVHKSGKMDDPNNYRGIAVTSCLGKLFISVLVNRLDLFCDQYKIIDDVQGGFRKNSRTSDNMFILNSLIRKFKYEKKTLYTCFINFAKAFDSIKGVMV